MCANRFIRSKTFFRLPIQVGHNYVLYHLLLFFKHTITKLKLITFRMWVALFIKVIPAGII